MADEILFSGDEPSFRLSRMARRGKLRRLGTGVYTPNLDEPPEPVCRRNWALIAAHFCPGALVADRSARLGQPDLAGNLFVVADRVRPVLLPGLTIIPRAGPGPLKDDVTFSGGLWVSSLPRAIVENQRPSRSVQGRPPRTLTEAEIADWLDFIVRNYRTTAVAGIRRRARQIAAQLGLEEEGHRADRLMGAVLQTETEPTRPTASPARRARAPFDADREPLFDRLFEALDRAAPMTMSAWEEDAPRRSTLPFWDAYFSNFIEGIEFTVDEAIRIVYENHVPRGRRADANDVLATYEVLSDEDEMRLRPSTFDEFEELLLRRHRRIMRARPESGPGQYKAGDNRAGSTLFVRPDLVRGTLLRGWDRLARLASPAHRAFFATFLVSEVHPFADGNGRTARVMMNAELHAGREVRAIVPVSYRHEYLEGLRRLSRQSDADPLVRMLVFARRYVAALDFSTLSVARGQLEATNAFVTPDEALSNGLHLVLPNRGPGPVRTATR
jgi:hypothetical protein